VRRITEGQSQADVVPVSGEAAQAVLVPTVGAAASMVVGEVVPCVSVGAVVLAHGAPCAFAQVGAPTPPVCFPCFLLQQAVLLRVGWHAVRLPGCSGLLREGAPECRASR